MRHPVEEGLKTFQYSRIIGPHEPDILVIRDQPSFQAAAAGKEVKGMLASNLVKYSSKRTPQFESHRFYLLESWHSLLASALFFRNSHEIMSVPFSFASTYSAPCREMWLKKRELTKSVLGRKSQARRQIRLLA